MINRDNWVDVRAFLRYQADTMQNSPLTVKSNRGHLQHVLTWADDKALTRAASIKPTLPAHMEGLSRDGKRFSGAYLGSFFKTTRYFLKWLRRENPTKFKYVGESWIDTLRASRERSEVAELRVRQIYTEEEVVKIAELGNSKTDLTIRRVGAAVALMFLSGMRIGAFLTMPIECVDLKNCEIRQLPELGVATKNRKAAVTTLLPIAELLVVVGDWDGFVRAALPGSAYWYAHLDRGAKLSQAKPSQANRSSAKPNFRKALLRLCAEAGVEYKSPHKLRHGFAVWGLKHAKTKEEMKAISQSLMHSSMGITDAIYSKLVEDDVHEAILGLGKVADGGSELELSIEKIMRRILKEKE